MNRQKKYIFITGGVLSGLGKGIMAASLGRLLKARGFKIVNFKFDAYINIDTATMSLSRHGEIFVTDDGGECDLDIGHYERFTDENLSAESNITMGRVYQSVINRERERGYHGEDVQVIPHITDEIKLRIKNAAEEAGADIAIVEIGGTAGDIESLPLIEAIRQMIFDEGRENVMFIHLTLVPYMEKLDEHKTKPTQHSVKTLQSLGIQPDIIVCRGTKAIGDGIKDKISLFCNVRRDSVIQNSDVDFIYDIPLVLEKEGLARLVCERLQIPRAEPDLKEWQTFCEKRRKAEKPLTIALISKYAGLKDACLSLTEALVHAAVSCGLRLVIKWVDAEGLEGDAQCAPLQNTDGIVIPAGFGHRGVEGMVAAARHARVNKIPFLGIGLGMHAAVIEYARNACGLKNAGSGEYDDTDENVIEIIPESKGSTDVSKMRKGASEISFADGSLLYNAYGTGTARERHRHRYEVNPAFRRALEDGGLAVTALSMGGTRIEGVELPAGKHPWFLAVQFNPEFKSRPMRPHALFVDFLVNSVGSEREGGR